MGIFLGINKICVQKMQRATRLSRAGRSGRSRPPSGTASWRSSPCGDGHLSLGSCYTPRRASRSPWRPTAPHPPKPHRRHAIHRVRVVIFQCALLHPWLKIGLLHGHGLLWAVVRAPSAPWEFASWPSCTALRINLGLLIFHSHVGLELGGEERHPLSCWQPVSSSCWRLAAWGFDSLFGGCGPGAPWTVTGLLGSVAGQPLTIAAAVWRWSRRLGRCGSVGQLRFPLDHNPSVTDILAHIPSLG